MIPRLLVALPLFFTQIFAAPEVSQTLNDYDQPFLYRFGTWDNKVEVKDGAAHITGVNNQGGAGHNISFDLSAIPDLIPALRLTVLEGNQATAIILNLSDEAQNTSKFEIPLKDVEVGKQVVLTPKLGASLTAPNGNGESKKNADLATIRQIAIIGNWSGPVPMAVELDAVLLVEADEAILAEQKKLAEEAKAKAEAERKQRE